jgi:hypothetical protein
VSGRRRRRRRTRRRRRRRRRRSQTNEKSKGRQGEGGRRTVRVQYTSEFLWTLVPAFDLHDGDVIWVTLKTYVSWALHSKRYETRLKKTVVVCNVHVISDVHCFEKHPFKRGPRGQFRRRHVENVNISSTSSSLSSSTWRGRVDANVVVVGRGRRMRRSSGCSAKNPSSLLVKKEDMEEQRAFW